ncbi:serine O-acetyltransferase [Jeotgalicoccus sp. FSL K6-3177]|uniref:serine O-acetyltransferase n=1 Tax=Jeotgalicoccus sp. FSL K6-3177 TaxID=2921494 RepID=UPI0030FD4A02
MFQRVKEDLDMVLALDPAAKNRLEVFFTYAGIHAVWAHLIAHWFYKKNFKVIARVISQLSRFVTGAEIHPGANIGRRLFIDHGMGVVIGETCNIGNDVTIYQGVTLGGTGKEDHKRHPDIDDNVLIAAGAKVLGNIRVGESSNVGANSVVLKNVPPHSTVVGIPGHIVKQHGQRVRKHNNFDHRDLPDPLFEKLLELEKEINNFRREVGNEVKDGSHI